jgi:hypothetical protein
MSEPELSEAAKHELEAGRKAKEESLKEFAARTKGKPTPTQEENDEAALGKHIVEHEADGADPDPQGQVHRNLEGGRGGSYQTRQSQPQHRPSGSSGGSSSQSPGGRSGQS